jgi:hypothetical protein
MTTLHHMLTELRVAAKGPARGELRARLRDLRGTTLDNGLKGGEVVVYKGKPYWVIGAQGDKSQLVSTDWAHRVTALASQVQRKHILWPKKLGSYGLGEDLEELAFLLEANPANDEAFRKEALTFLDKLRRELGKPDVIKDLEGMPHKKTQGLAMPAEWVDRRYKDLLLIFTPKSSAKKVSDGKVGGGFGQLGKQRWKVILLPVLAGPFDPKYLKTRIDTGVFLHEFVHYLDNKRGKGFILKRDDTSERQLGRGDADYYNDPGEFNAYYQEAARSVDAILKSAVRPERSAAANQKMLDVFVGGMKSAQAFTKAMLDRHVDKHFAQSLNPKYKRKLLIRLAGLYTHLKNKYLS